MIAWFEKYAKKRKPVLTVARTNLGIYLERWALIPSNRFFNIYLHKFTNGDVPVLHDHPWASLSFVLKGRFVENFKDSGRLCVKGRLYFRLAKTLHYLEKIDPEPTWTLFITGPETRQWGFWTEEGWFPSFEYRKRSIHPDQAAGQ